MSLFDLIAWVSFSLSFPLNTYMKTCIPMYVFLIKLSKLVLSCLKDWNYDPPRPPRLAFSLFFTLLSGKQLFLEYVPSPTLRGLFVAHALKFEKLKYFKVKMYILDHIFSADFTMQCTENTPLYLFCPLKYERIPQKSRIILILKNWRFSFLSWLLKQPKHQAGSCKVWTFW